MSGRGSRSRVARAGWAFGGAIGAGILAVVALIAGVTDADPEQGVGIDIAAYLIVLVPIGLVLGCLVGLCVQVAARARLAHRGRPSRPAARQPVPPAPPPAIPLTGEWARHHVRCRDLVARFRVIVDSAPADAQPTRWLRDIAADLDKELVEVERLARYGQALAPTAPRATDDPTVRRIVDRLERAERGFDATVRRAGDIVLNLAGDQQFARIRAQLDVLGKEAPHLRDLPPV
ncbi:hypothetical protein SAMN05421810_103238 [Amycolatopsis arida]|uniref:Uncharacterized protein n=1 Tax=Amycolatopsis arida TaxID=587909 RepID=A0A1I5SR04_9PSEU|nr:hypothetical protein [Amycolatopsis arida]TDX96383.1 hypothetical protein CLV69_103520 [Amycolatopsis arida]SFP73098.1 hypothetical protein SAMN05421810_103238 [Amycolatopsis arida]